MTMRIGDALRHLGNGPLATRQRPKRAARRSWFRLEALEDRTVMSTSIPLNGQTWTAVGPAPILGGQTPGGMPQSGRVTAIAASPTDPNTIYIGAAGGGVWKTTNGGTAWTPLTDNMPTLIIGALAIAPSNPNVLYAGTGTADYSGDSYSGHGIFKTTDGGATWTVVGQSQFDRRAFTKIVVDPTDANIAYAAMGEDFSSVDTSPSLTGLYKTTDGGATWSNTTTSISTTAGYTDVVIDPTNPSTVYVAAGSGFGDATNGVYKSTDAGKTWAPAGNFAGGVNTGVIRIAIAASDPKTLYASVSDPQTLGAKSIQKTTDGGGTWTATTATPNYLGSQGVYDTAIGVDPKDAKTVFVSGSFASFSNGNFIQGILESTDAGASWNDISVGADLNGPHVDHHAMAFTADGKLLDGNDGGVWRLNNASLSSITWASLNGNLQITQFTGIALHPTDPNIMYGGSQDNGTEKFSDNLKWQLVQFGDGGHVRVDQTNGNTVYHTFYYGGGGFFERSDDGGATWTAQVNGLDTSRPANFYVPFVMDPSNSSRLLLGTDRVNMTTNKGASWAPISAPGSGGWTSSDPIDAIAIAPSDPNTIYAAAGGDYATTSHIFVTRNGGTSWTQVDLPGGVDHIKDIQVDSANPLIVYAVRDRYDASNHQGKVFRSADGGKTWSNITGNLPDLPANTLVQIKLGTLTGLVVGTQAGAYASFDGGATWGIFKSGLPNVAVTELVYNTKTNILAAGTYGRGVYETLGIDPLVVMAFAPAGLVEHKPGIGLTVSTFTDAVGPGPATQYSASIDWGDGVVTQGTVTQTGSGSYSVTSDKTYNQGGTYTLKVTITKQGGTSSSATAKVTVGDLPIVVNVNPIATSPVEGVPYSGEIATFYDTDPTPSAPSAYLTTIDWGDGTVSTGTVTQTSAGHYSISGTHTFGAGNLNLKVTVKGPGGGSASSTSPVTVIDNPMTAEPVTIDAVEGAEFTGMVATFSDSDPRNHSVAYYSAIIDWNDGTKSSGTITALPGGGFGVIGTHTFTVGPIKADVTIKDSDVSTVTVRSEGSAANAPIFLTASSIHVDEGSGSNVLIGTFQDTNILSAASDFRLSVDWGDGKPATDGLVVWNGRGNYVLVGNHAYTYDRTPFNMTLKLREVKMIDGVETTVGEYTSTAQAYVTNAPLTASGGTITAAEGDLIPSSTLVSTFTDGNIGGSPGDYTATITWGNGQTSPGEIKATDTPGKFQVYTTDYRFPTAGTFFYTVEVVDNVGTPVDASGTATISDAPLAAINQDISGTEATSTGVVQVGSFFDPNPQSNPDQFTATISWGDGTTDTGTIVATDRPGLYRVVGAHTYANPGTYATRVAVTSAQGSTTATAGTAGIVDLILPLTGKLIPSSDTGASSGDGITNATGAAFRGTAQPNSVIHLYAGKLNGGGLVPSGTATSDANGAFTIDSNTLAPGEYVFYAQATDAAGRPGSALTKLEVPGHGGTLLVDDTSPTVAGLSFDPRTNTFRVLFGEPISGLDLNGLLSASNYSVLHNGRGQGPTSVTADPTNGNAILVHFNLGRARGIYQITMNSSGLRDLAGNVLNEQYYVALPGSPHHVGDNYVAQVNTNGRTTTGPMLVTSPNQVQASRQFGRFLRGRTLRFR